MITKIVSGGQTGVDRAALDVALSRELPCGGWCPQGRLAEDGRIPLTYPLRETPSSLYDERTRWNVRDSDGTLIITWGPPTHGTALTVSMALMLMKPFFVADLSTGTVTASEVVDWLRTHGILILNVAGPRAGKFPEIYAQAHEFLNRLLDADGNSW